MIGRFNAFLFSGRLACDLLPLFAFAMAYVVRFSGILTFSLTDYEPRIYFGLLVLTTIVWTVVADQYAVAVVDLGVEQPVGIRRVVVAHAMTYMILLTFLFFYRVQSFSRVFLATSAIVLFGGAIVLRSILVAMAKRHKIAGTRARLLIVGTDEFAKSVASRLTSPQNLAYHVAGFVGLKDQHCLVGGAPVFQIDELDAFAVGNPIDEIVVALPPARFNELALLLPALERIGVPIRVVLDFGTNLAVRNNVCQIAGLNVATLTCTPLDTIYYVLFKRAVDILVSILAIVLTSPLMMLIVLAIRLTSRGPICFVQERVGLNGRVFRMYKFRTMRVAPDNESDTRWTRPNDDRCTRIGAILRKTSLDELPQFLNVLRGEMSVVGPRPERPHFVRQFLHEMARYNSRHGLKVGITGWAQVHGLRGDTSIHERLQYDLYYLQNWSLGLDLRIMAMTIRHGLLGKNAY